MKKFFHLYSNYHLKTFMILCCLFPLLNSHAIIVDLYFNNTPSPYISEWESQVDIATLSITNDGAESIRVKIHATILVADGANIAEGWSRPFEILSGETEIVNSDQLIDWGTVTYDKSLEGPAMATGMLPENNYMIQIELYNVNTDDLLYEDEADFHILTFSQPSLISPIDEDIVEIQQQPFEWEAVNDDPSFEAYYWLRIYEMLPNQSPQDAVSSNILFFEEELINQTSLIYPFDGQEFIDGKQYAWYVQAVDRNNHPIGENDGKSEVWIFSYGVQAGDLSELFAGIDRLIIDPNMAYLTDLADLEIIETETSYILGGEASLTIDGIPAMPTITVLLEEFTIDRDDLENLNILEGRLYGEITGDDLDVNFGELPFMITELQFDIQNGFTIDGRLSLDCALGYIVDSQLSLTQQGLTGDLIVSVPPGEQGCILGEPPVQLEIDEARIHFSNPTMSLIGQLYLFGNETPCAQNEFVFGQDGAITTQIDCPVQLGQLTFHLRQSDLRLVIDNQIQSAELDINGLHALILSDDSQVDVLFNQMTIDLLVGQIVSGDAGIRGQFGLKFAPTGGMWQWESVPLHTELIEDFGVLLNCIDNVNLSSEGITFNQELEAQAHWAGVPYLLQAIPSPDFRLSIEPIGVAQDHIEFFSEEQSMGFLDQTGFRLNLNPEFIEQALPDTLPLPSMDIAYLVLRENGEFLVNQEEVANGLRLFSREDLPSTLAFPLFHFNQPAAPQLEVQIDIIVDANDYHVVSGNIDAIVPDFSLPDFNLSEFGIPLQITRFNYHRIQGEYAYTIFGKLVMFGNETPCEVEQFTLTRDGELTGRFVCESDWSIPLIPDSERLWLHIFRTGGNIEVDFSMDQRVNLEAPVEYRIDTQCQLEFVSTMANDPNNCQADMHVVVTRDTIIIEEFTPSCDPNLAMIDPDWLTLSLGDLTPNHFGYNDDDGWRFALNLDIDLDFPLMDDFDLPTFEGVRVDRNGFHFPELFLPELEMPPLELPGILIQPLALQLPEFDFNWFGGDENGEGFAFDLDMELQFPQFPDLRLPRLNGIGLGSDGLRFPAMDFPELGQLPSFELNGFQLTPLSFSIPEFTLSLDGDDGVADEEEGRGFQFDFKLNFPEFGADLPECLRHRDLFIRDATFQNGQFAGGIEGVAIDEPGCRIPLGGDAFLDILQLGGAFSQDENQQQDILVDIAGRLMLPEAFQCEGHRGPLEMGESHLSMNGNGLIRGTVEGLIPPCPVTLGALTFQVTNSEIVFDVINDAQSIIMRLDGRLELPGQDEGEIILAAGVLRYDLMTGEMLESEIAINEPFRWSIPREDPVITFLVNRAVLNQNGLLIDGDNWLILEDNVRVRVRFDQLLINLADLSIISGNATIQGSFGMKIIGEGDQLAWTTVPQDAELGDENGLLLKFLSTITINANGVTPSGDMQAQLRWGGVLYPVQVSPSDDFAFSWSPFGVLRGQLEFFYDNRSVGFLDAGGFFPNIQFLLPELPASFPLPALDIAFLTIKSGDDFLINYENTIDGLHLFTLPDVSIDLVFPSLQFERMEPPSVSIALDIYVDRADFSLLQGSIEVTIPDPLLPDFNLSDFGIPLQLRGFHYHLDGDLAVFDFNARLALFGMETPCDLQQLQLTADGRFRGSVECRIDQTFPLIPDSENLMLTLSTISGALDIQLLQAIINYELTAEGILSAQFTENSACDAEVTLAFNPLGVEIERFHPTCNLEQLALDLGFLEITLDGFQLTQLGFGDDGWDFAFQINQSKFTFPDLPGFQLPPVRGLGLGQEGLSFPEWTFNDHDLRHIEPFDLNGFRLKPLGFRMPRFNLPLPGWSSGADDDAPEEDGSGFRFDFEIDLRELEQEMPECLRDAELTLLDCGFENGVLIGAIEPTVIPPPGCSLPLGGGLFFNILELGGNLASREVEGNAEQAIDVQFRGSLTLPEYLRCDGQRGPIEAGQTWLTLNEQGLITGTIENLAPACPLQLGPFAMRIIRANVIFNIDDNAQSVLMDLQGDLELPGPQGRPVSVRGDLVYDLINNRIHDGQLALNRPFLWQLPQEDPLFTFLINNAVLDREGLLINGRSPLVLDQNNQAEAVFDNLLLDLETMNIQSGNLRIDGHFGLQYARQNQNWSWTTVPANAVLDADNGLLLKFMGSVTIDTLGLATSGQLDAACKWQGRDYAFRAEPHKR